MTFPLKMELLGTSVIHVMTKLVFCILSLCFFHECLEAVKTVLDEALLCRQCGHEVTITDQLINIPSSEALIVRNSTLLGSNDSPILIQQFVNPYGKKFEVITSRKAEVYKDDQSVSTKTFFPGFAWRIIACPRCGFQLGWFFQPIGHTKDKKTTPDTFFGLILENLHHKGYADNLLIVPKFRNS